MISRAMTVRGLGLLGVLWWSLSACEAEVSAETSSRAVIDLSQEVWALQCIHDFDLSAEQLRKLQALWSDVGTGNAAGEEPANKTPRKLVTLLRKLRDALVKADDQDLIDELRDDLASMREDDDMHVPDHVVVKDAARARVKKVVRFLQPSQIASYLAAYEDEIPDPVEALTDAVPEARGAEPGRFKELCDENADELGPLLGGIDPDKVSRQGEKIRKWLSQWRELSDAEFKVKAAEVKKSAEDLVDDVDAFVVLRRWVERDLAELLSNPQLGKAIEERLKVLAAGEK